MQVSPAFQAEENVVCNLDCMTTQHIHDCHLISRSAVPDAGVCLQGLPSSLSFAVSLIPVVSEMPGAPTKSAADKMTAARHKVGPPAILGANPNSYFLRDHNINNRMSMFNDIFSLYMNGRFFRQKEMKKEFWTEDPTALTELLVTDVQWYERHFRKTSKMFTMLLRHDNSPQLQGIRRNRVQGDVALIDFLLTVIDDAAQLPEAVSCVFVGPRSLRGQAALHIWHRDWYQQPSRRSGLLDEVQQVPHGGKAG